MSSTLFTTATETPAGYHDVQPTALSTIPKEVRIVDVREPAEFTGELGHIPQATLAPLGDLAVRAAAWPKDSEVLVVCRSGGRSARGAAQLRGMGFTKVMNLAGGMLAYATTGLQVTR